MGCAEVPLSSSFKPAAILAELAVLPKMFELSKNISEGQTCPVSMDTMRNFQLAS